jgi:(2R)-ethylmalonyl-CoA mutase
VLTVPIQVEAEQIERLKNWRSARDETAVAAALAELRSAAHEDRNIMPASIAAAKTGVTTGEWGAILRDVFGEYRAPTGVSKVARQQAGGLDSVREAVERVSQKLGTRLKLLVGKPGLDGHSNGAEQIAVRARDAGIEVIYDGIRLTPAEIVRSALEQNVHCVGLSILSGSHVTLVGEVIARLKAEGRADLPVIVGGIIPPQDADRLRAAGARAIYTPKDFAINDIVAAIVETIDASASAEA